MNVYIFRKRYPLYVLDIAKCLSPCSCTTSSKFSFNILVCKGSCKGPVNLSLLVGKGTGNKNFGNSIRDGIHHTHKIRSVYFS